MIQLGILIIIATVLAILSRLIKQPPLVAYLITGLILGSVGSGIAATGELLKVASEIGIILLLFMAGLEINLERVKKVLKMTLVIGFGQIILMSIGFFLIALKIFGYGTLTSVYIGIALTLSSTIVVIKTLADRKETEALHGQILIGVMILQDIFVMGALTILTNLGGNVNFGLNLLLIVLKATFVALTLYLISRLLLAKIFDEIAKSIELIFLAGLAWCFVGVNIAWLVDFSIEIGAFLAGFAIANLPFAFEIEDKARSLRDFGLLLFFAYVGSQVQLTKELLLSAQTITFVILEIFGTFLIIAVISSFLGLKRKHGFFVSSIPCQVSEFALVLVAIGFQLGHINNKVLSLITTIVIITIILSSAILANLNWLFKKIESYFKIYEWRCKGKKYKDIQLKKHVVVFGLGGLGENIVKHFLKKKKQVVVVDWHPSKIKLAKKHGFYMIYADAGDPDVWEEVNIKEAVLVVSTIGANIEDDLNLGRWIRKNHPEIVSIAETNVPEEVPMLKKAGYDFVLYQDEAEWVFLKKYLNNPSIKRRVK